jgi:hypothetical protein
MLNHRRGRHLDCRNLLQAGIFRSDVLCLAQEVALGVRDPRVEAAFAAVAREDFLGPGPWQIHLGCMAGEPVDAQNNMTGASFGGQERVVELPSGLWLNFEDGPAQIGGFPRRVRSLRCEAQAELSRKVMAGEVISGR